MVDGVRAGARREWLAQGVPMASGGRCCSRRSTLYERKRPRRQGARERRGERRLQTMTRRSAERGFVSLVGAGPGDPDLLTRKAAERLADADLVLYDALVDPATLELAPSAQRVFVGKRAGRPQVRQEFIHWLMVRAARAGKKVVRLKGGDPFVFGRGGEEGAGARRGGSSLRGRARRQLGDRRRRARRHSGHAPRRRVRVRGRVRSRRGRVSAGPRSLAPHSATIVVMMGLGGSSTSPSCSSRAAGTR